MNKERLLKVAEVLKEVRPKLFDLGSWFNQDSSDICGTTCCAVGWAAQHPYFRDRGFCLNFQEPDYEFSVGINATPYFRGYEDFEAVCEFFGISEMEADYLFDPTGYDSNPSKKKVIARIKTFVRNRKIDWTDVSQDFRDQYE